MRTLSDWVNDLLVDSADAADQPSPALAEALGSKDPILRDRAAELMVTALGKAEGHARAKVLRLLQAWWWPPSKTLGREAYAATLQFLSDGALDETSMRDAFLLWSHLARFDRGLVSEIASGLDHASAQVRLVAAGAIGRLGEDGRELIPRLAAAVADPDRGVSDAALEALSALAPLAPEAALPSLWEQARVSVGRRKLVALSALRGVLEARRSEGQVVDATPDQERTLFEAVMDADPGTRMQAVGLLGLRPSLGPDADAALNSRLGDPEIDVRAAAAVALLRLSRALPEANALLERQLCSEERLEQDAAIYALEPVEVETLSHARPALEAAAERGRGVGREAAIGLLLRLGS